MVYKSILRYKKGLNKLYISVLQEIGISEATHERLLRKTMYS